MPKQEFCFIQSLYNAIEQNQASIVTWDPTGKGFIVNDLPKFISEILVKQFGIGRLDSFARKLNKHGFKRSKIALDKIRFYHKYFTQDSKNLERIRKLTKEESLPKHIKLKLMRESMEPNSLIKFHSDSSIGSSLFDTSKTLEISPEFYSGLENADKKQGRLLGSSRQNSIITEGNDYAGGPFLHSRSHKPIQSESEPDQFFNAGFDEEA